jgi:hypothetical protein
MGVEAIDPRDALQDLEQLGRALEDHRRPEPMEQQGIPDKLEDVADSLLADQEQPQAGAGEAVPGRLGHRFGREGLLAMPPLVLGRLPLLAEGDAQIIAGLGIGRPEPQRLVVAGNRLVELPRVADGVAQIIVWVAEVGLEANGLAIVAGRFLVAALPGEHDTQVWKAAESGRSRTASR